MKASSPRPTGSLNRVRSASLLSSARLRAPIAANAANTPTMKNTSARAA